MFGQSKKQEEKKDNPSEVKKTIFDDDTQEMQNKNESSKTQDICFRAFKFSRKFFTTGINDQITNKFMLSDLLLEDLDKDTYFRSSEKIVKKIKPVLQSMSKIYKDITTFPVFEDAVKDNICKDGILTILQNEIGLGQHMIDIVKSHYTDKNANSSDNDEKANSGDKYILFMQGPVGSYKNRLLQYVYLSLCGEFAKDDYSIKVPVFYIDFSKYESSSKDFDIEKDIETIKGIINSHQVPPLFILDNVRGFEFGNITNKYEKFREQIVCKNCKLIVSRDVDFNRNGYRFLPMQFGVEADYKNKISITSISVNKTKYCKDFINACVAYFKQTGDIGDSKLKSDDIYRCLVEMEETAIDAYQIRLIIDVIINAISEQRNDLDVVTIYSRILASITNKSEIYQTAYEYEYTNKDCINNIPEWCKIIKHRSTLDYCIAQYYVQQLTNIIQNNLQGSYNVPNAIFYKGINRFIVPQVNSMGWGVYEYIEKCYNEYQNNEIIENKTPELSQLFYILGKYDKRDYSERATTLLQTIKNNVNQSQSLTLRKRFLLRTIYVSLIWRGDKTSAFEYFKELIVEEGATLSEAAKINMGFHLVYYDDTNVGFGENSMPDYTTVDVRRCLNTLRKLLTEIGSKSSEAMDLIGVLHLITVCHILKENIKNISEGGKTRFKKYKIKPIDPAGKFLQKCRKLCIKLSDTCKFKQTDIGSFFQKAYENMTDALVAIRKRLLDNYWTDENTKNVKHNVDIYNKYSRLNEIPRTGWITRGIKEGFEQREGGNNYYKKYNVPENVAEHTLNCWLLGYIFLPERDYKQRVLDLLLVHDFAEVEVGDIIKKKTNDIELEQDEMGRFLNDSPLFEDWKNVWGTGYEENDKRPIQVAHDIDKIQAMYQYFSYYAAKVISQKDNNVGKWLKEYGDLRTDIGRGIAKVVVFLNEKFFQNKDLCILFYDKYTEIVNDEQSSKTDNDEQSSKTDNDEESSKTDAGS